MAEEIQYVYAVVDARFDAGGAPPGIDGAPVRLQPARDVAALVSSVDGDVYSGPEVEDRTADLEWLGHRARAHNGVITWADDRGAVVPLPMFSLFRDSEGVATMLGDRREELKGALARVRDRQEYGVRVFRIDDALTANLAELSPRIAEMTRTAAAASPGQRYLLTRKLEAEQAAEVRRIGIEVAQHAFDTLSRHASDAVLDALPRRTLEGMAGTAVLNASFLLPRADTEPFRRELTALIEEYEPRGFRFEFTGPWPPYHFVQGGDDER